MVNTLVPEATATQLPATPTSAGGKGDVQTISLQEGWNLISFRVVAEDRTLVALLEEIAGLYEEVTTMKGDEIRTFIPGRPAELNDFKSVDLTSGLWIRMNRAASLTVEGSPIPAGVPIELHKGWNLIAYTPEVPLPVGFALASIVGKYTEVRGFDAEAQSHFPGLPEEFNTLSVMQPGMGYLVHVTEDAQLSYLEVD